MNGIRDINERELAALCAKGDRNAFGELYRRYAPSMFAICLRYCGDRIEAEDLLQDGFVKLFRATKDFAYRGEGSLKGWMSRIFVNEAISRIRKNKRYLEVPVPTDTAEDIEDDGLIGEIGPEVLMEMLGELPVGYRTVLNLFIFEGKSHQEISEMLGIARNSSTSQLHRARKMLKEKIKEYLKRQQR